MTTIKALEGRTVHQIQSGQVIVDLCSVVKELVENGLDAGATAIDVRFKTNGLESIEVQDNGVGISSENYETIALKHYTSKLTDYDDLSSLQTFGFRGEALSSLCALSNFHIVTARAEDAPKGTRLDFEISGKLKSTQVVASQKGTTVAVENLFANLPVRRRELEKNAKREYGKVLTHLQAYACISTQAKLSVSNVMTKGKKVTVFATKSNNTTRENIANVFGAKVLPALVAMDLNFELQQSGKSSLQSSTDQLEQDEKKVRILGHVSRPVFGEGRQTPDRQMFFVNSRPCGLPQVAKIFNEVYKSFNLSQSPFVFANIMLNTNAYDVNVSPDKRTILLHDQDTLLENIRYSLVELFEMQDQTVPQTQPTLQKLPSYKKLTVYRETSTAGSAASGPDEPKEDEDDNRPIASEREPQSSIASTAEGRQGLNLIGGFAGRDAMERVKKPNRPLPVVKDDESALTKDKQKLLKKLSKGTSQDVGPDDYDVARDVAESDALMTGQTVPVLDFNKRIAEQQVSHEEQDIPSRASSAAVEEDAIPSVASTPAKPSPGVVQNAFDRMRPKRQTIDVAEVTVGEKTITMALGPTASKRQKFIKSPSPAQVPKTPAMQRFSSSMQSFTAPGTQVGSPEDDGIPGRPEPGLDNEDPQDGDESPSDEEAMEPGLRQDSDSEASGASEDGQRSRAASPADDADSDEEYLDDTDKKAKEDAKVALLIQQAEEAAALPSQDNIKRAHNLLQGKGQKDKTTHLLQSISCSIERIGMQLQELEASLETSAHSSCQPDPSTIQEAPSAEERLSLTVSKEDFSRMHIIGQFNLGFILTVRPSHSSNTTDELFIIDQHASDEKSNFERLQSTTIVQNQRLVRPHQLDLTAIEEEIILENNSALLKNGFLVDIDTSGDIPVGQRCRLVSLPMSREVTFDTGDLEELIALLAESPSSAAEHVPRPSKVRKMFAMRACRSSIMIGKSLSLKQMEKLVRRMGEIDKPWNCPHGRPTMRHVFGLGSWEGWMEGNGETDMVTAEKAQKIDWGTWMQKTRAIGEGGFHRDFSEASEEEQQDTSDAHSQEREEDTENPEEEGEEGEEADERGIKEEDEVEREDPGERIGAGEDFMSTLRSRFAHTAS